jgi:hypothetical protein
MKFSLRQHIVERRHDRRCGSTIEFRKSINQQLQARRQLEGLSPERLAKPLSDLIADRAAVSAINPYICGVLFRHNKIQQNPT